MKFVTLIPWQLWIIALLLLWLSYTFGLSGFVCMSIILLLII